MLMAGSGIRESLNKSFIVIPVKAGIQQYQTPECRPSLT